MAAAARLGTSDSVAFLSRSLYSAHAMLAAADPVRLQYSTRSRLAHVSSVVLCCAVLGCASSYFRQRFTSSTLKPVLDRSLARLPFLA